MKISDKTFNIFKRIVGILFILLIAYIGFMYYVFHPREGKKYFFPEKYRGWVCITYEKKGAPPLEIEEDALILKIPLNGKVETSSRSTIVNAPGYYVPTYSENYYYLKNGIREAKELVMGGGFTIQNESQKEFTSYFWVSTKEKSKSDYEKYVKNRDVMQNPICGEWE